MWATQVDCVLWSFVVVLWSSVTATSGQISAYIDLDKVLQETDERYLSVTLGPSIIEHNWKSFNLSSRRLHTLASALAPSLLRFGGSEADLLIFNKSQSVFESNEDSDIDVDFFDYGEEFFTRKLSNFSMNERQWDQLNLFTLTVGWNLLFDLNVLLRKHGCWDPANAIQLLQYSIKRNYTYNLDLELGNEPNALKHFINQTIGSEQLAADFLSLHSILKSRPQFSRSLLVGPDTTSPKHATSRVLEYMHNFLKGAGRILSAITWHQYYINGRTAQLSDFVKPTVLNLFGEEARRILAVVEASGLKEKPLMLGETGSCWGGGAPNLSDRYVAGFLWMDKLGLAAQLGHTIVMRQTFFGGHYNLINKELEPTPDYWLSLVFKNLVGTKVFNTSVSDTSQGLRMYAHCTNTQRSRYESGALTVYIVNVHASSMTIQLSGASMKSQLKHIYWFMPYKQNLASRYVMINNKKMEMNDDATLPDIKPVVRREPHLLIPPVSFGFVVLPLANVVECRNR